MGISMMRFGCVFLAFVCVLAIFFFGCLGFGSVYLDILSCFILRLPPLCFFVFILNHTTRRLSGVEKGYTKMDRKVFLYSIMFLCLV